MRAVQSRLFPGPAEHLFLFLILLLVHTCTPTSTNQLTKGRVWPEPRFINFKKTQLTLDSTVFHFKVTAETCDIIQEAIKRYSDVIKKLSSVTDLVECGSPDSLDTLQVELTSPCQQTPQADMKENYELHVNKDFAVLKSDSVWGILRGLETFSQILIPTLQEGCLVVNNTDILDYPRFSHRGLLLDTSRHYLPTSIILNILSGMEMNKMNVLHWHIVDDQSFPYQSTTFPSLSAYGAYDPIKAVYTQETIKSIIEYARLRGIRVLPEFDSPGHTQSWGKGVNKLLTACFVNGSFSGQLESIDPSRRENFKFVTSLLTEVKNVFPDRYIHLGGDEVSYTCWDSNPAVQEFMKQKNFTKSEELEGYYISEVLNILNQIEAKGIVWEEVFVHNANLLPNDTVVQIWKGESEDLVQEVTSKGLPVLISHGWYLDHLKDLWNDFYAVDPTDFNGTNHQKELVLGGEACMWGEMVDETNIVPRIWPRASAVAERLWSSDKVCYEWLHCYVLGGEACMWGEMVDETNIVPRIWPRASAVAERLWSSDKVNDAKTAAPRLNEHVCRMKRRGVKAEPASGPGYCPH